MTSLTFALYVAKLLEPTPAPAIDPKGGVALFEKRSYQSFDARLRRKSKERGFKPN